jgi:AraC-like DNA-binding protein
MAKRGRKPGQTSPEMAEKKRRAMNLIEVNPTLSMAAVARHVGVSECSVNRWFSQAGMKRWFC